MINTKVTSNANRKLKPSDSIHENYHPDYAGDGYGASRTRSSKLRARDSIFRSNNQDYANALKRSAAVPRRSKPADSGYGVRSSETMAANADKVITDSGSSVAPPKS